VPPDLTTPTTSYRLQVLVVLASLFLFALLYVGLTVGSAYLCYSAFASLAGTDPYHVSRSAFQDAFKEDQRISKVYNDAVQQVQQGKMDDAAMLQLVERDVLPPWRAQIERLARVKELSAEEQRLVEQYGEAVKAQQESWEFLCRAIREKNDLWVQEARARAQRAGELEKKFSTDASRFYSRHTPQKADFPFWRVVIGILAGVLCLFLVKGFFKWGRAKPPQQLEVREKNQPTLFAFIRQLCRDTGAPLPRRVYLTADVNAAVSCHLSFLNLVVPPSKNLIIGLGLVNRLNLTEFKAVLAHEFGHFSQHSLKLGSYVYVSNRIIGDVVYGRDWLDALVAGLRGEDIRVAVFAWAFTGLLWGLRKTLERLYRLINFANVALARQMEYNADLVAISVTGSDALIHALARLNFAADALAQAAHDLSAAAGNRLYSRDLFYHQTRAAEHLRALGNDSRLGEPPPLPEDPRQTVQVFPPEDTSVPKMWATHPSNHDREVNAKKRYVRSPIDERSPWLLFQDAPALREQLTCEFYEATGQPDELKLEDPEVVQSFIDAEHAETTYHPRYHGLYDQRCLAPGDLDELVRAAPTEFADPSRLAEAQATLYGAELKDRMTIHQARQREHALLAGLREGAVELKAKDFQFRDARYQIADAKRLLEQVRKELDGDFAWMSNLDRQVFLVHHEMARQVGEEVQRELEKRYRFHLAVQDIHSRLAADNTQVQVTLAQLTGKPELTQLEYHGALSVFRSAYESLGECLKAAEALRLPALKNVAEGEPLAGFLSTRPLNHPYATLDNEWIGWFLERLGEALDKARRIHFKSLGGILALQEKLGEQWSSNSRPGSGSSPP
jgi:Zn-dependent protease with chaperone function